MEQTSFTERLMEFGLTRQEASIYQCLLTEGKVTGYEVAKQTGISVNALVVYVLWEWIREKQ